MNRAPDSRIGSAPADIAGHGFINIGVGRRRILRQQNRRAHNLTRLAVAALRDVNFYPRALERMRPIARQPFDGFDLFPLGTRNRRHTRAHCLPFQMNRAGAAQRHSAAILRARQLQVFPQDPQQGRGRHCVNLNFFPVHRESDHGASPFPGSSRWNPVRRTALILLHLEINLKRQAFGPRHLLITPRRVECATGKTRKAREGGS